MKKYLTFLLCFILIFSATVAFSGCSIKDNAEEINQTSGTPQTITVPDLVGQVYTNEMKEELEAEGFNITVELSSSTQHEPNTILEQDPVGGAKRIVVDDSAKTNLTLTICRDENASTLELPDYTNMDYRDAEIKMEKLELNTTVKFEFNDLFEEGRVIRTDPEKGTVVSKGTLITLYVSQGSSKTEKIKLPDYTNQYITNVQSDMSNLNLRYMIIDEYSDEYPVGYVIKTVPEAGTEVVPDRAGVDAEDITMINLYISRGKKPE